MQMAERRVGLLLAHFVGADTHARRQVVSGDSVHVRVDGKTDDGTAVNFYEDDEISFRVGDNEVFEALEMAVMGMSVGQSLAFTVTTDDSSHPCPTRDEELVLEFPADQLPQGVGVPATLQLNSNQGPRPATLVKLTRETATLDLNDPIAGKDLHMIVVVKDLDVEVQLEDVVFDVPASVPDRKFDLEELHKFNGVKREEIYISVNGIVYDMSGAGMYSPSGSYGLFAGHDASLALAKYAISAELLDRRHDGDALDRDQQRMLAHWVRTFNGKYPAVGRLVTKLR